METITLRLPWAPTINSAWKHARGRTYLSKEYNAFLRNVAALNIQPIPYDACRVEIILFPPHYRIWDIDNRVKTTLDALTRVGFWKDDSIVHDLRVIRGAPVYNPCIYVKVTKLKQEFLVSGEEYGEQTKPRRK